MGVHPSWFFALTSTFSFASSTFTAAMCPYRQLQNSGVLPAYVALVGSTSFMVRSMVSAATEPLRAAMYVAVAPDLARSFTSTCG